MKTKDTKVIYLRSADVTDEAECFITIKDIFTPNRVGIPTSLFIKEYQRPYCWNKKQIIELINDIEQCGETNSHFTGVLYFGSDEVNHGCSIIDGQQRIISIYLIFKYLNSNYDTNFKIEINIFENDGNPYGKYIDVSNFLSPTSPQISQIIRNNNLLKEYKKSVSKSYKIISDYFNGKDASYKESFKNKLLTKLFFLAIKCEDKVSENALFRIVNAKGQLLDDIDKIKSFLLQTYYDKKNDVSAFINKWTILNKSGKKSLNLFFKLLMNNLTNNRTNSSGKVKYENFVEHAEKHHDFRNIFEKEIDKFSWIPTDFSDLTKRYISNKSKNWKNIVTALFLANKLQLRDKIAAEIGSDKFNEYKTGRRNPILLFVLYILTYICETNYSFSGSENIEKINYFQSLTEHDRKNKVRELWKTFCEKKKLDEIQYKLNGFNDSIDRIRQKHNCLFPLIVLTKCYQDNNFLEFAIEHKDAHKDHYIPKKITETSVRKNIRSDNWKFVEPTKEINSLLCSINNICFLSPSGNATKSNKIPIEFLIKDGEKYSGINYEKIEEYINEVRDNTYDKLNDLINRLTGN